VSVGFVVTAIATFLNNRISQQSSEDSDHYRNDALLAVIRHIANLERVRNQTGPSQTHGSRLDAYLFRTNYPPLVSVEEKPRDDQIQEATNDFVTKFMWMEHYTSNWPYLCVCSCLSAPFVYLLDIIVRVMYL
jgi:hypothetical protein